MINKITVAYGDGIGPEIMKACLRVLTEARANLEFDEIKIGEAVYLDGHTSGIKDKDWEKIVNNKVFLKAPITTPQGGGYKSLNVTIRKTLGLYANIRPVKSLVPYVASKHPGLNHLIVRENEEDLYAGIEHRQTREVYQCLKLMSRPGTEKIIRYGFELAKRTGRKTVTCMTKDNIMKLTDGLFHKVFDEIAAEYPEINSNHSIIDIGSAKLAENPNQFDVIILPNLYGDILSDISAEIAGSVGLCGSANIGEECAMFEAIHGSAPDIAGKKIANPSGLIQAAVQMLEYIGKGDIAEKIENALLATIEDGIHTADIYNSEYSKKKVSTDEFADALIERLGKKPQNFSAAKYSNSEKRIEIKLKSLPKQNKTLDGIDVFLDCDKRDPNQLGESLISAVKESNLELIMITNRGVKVFPQGNPLTFCTDHWRCRFMASDRSQLNSKDIIKLQSIINEAGFDIIKTENLYKFDDIIGYSLGQGQ